MDVWKNVLGVFDSGDLLQAAGRYNVVARPVIQFDPILLELARHRLIQPTPSSITPLPLS